VVSNYTATYIGDSSLRLRRITWSNREPVCVPSEQRKTATSFMSLTVSPRYVISNISKFEAFFLLHGPPYVVCHDAVQNLRLCATATDATLSLAGHDIITSRMFAFAHPCLLLVVHRKIRVIAQQAVIRGRYVNVRPAFALVILLKPILPLALVLKGL
jgi:hypothetical protein